MEGTDTDDCKNVNRNDERLDLSLLTEPAPGITQQTVRGGIELEES